MLLALVFSYYIWDLATEPATFTVWGADYHDFLSASGLTIGDINGDGIGDLIINVPGGDGPGNTRPSCGELVIFFGKPGFSGSVDLLFQNPDLWIIGPDSNLSIGISPTVGDVNGDGFGDILFADGQRHAYLIYGSDTLTGIRDLAVDSADYFIDGEGYGTIFARHLEIVDVNNDGLPDLLFGDEDTSDSQSKVDIIFNDGNLVGTRVFASDPPDAIIWGPGSYSGLGQFGKGDADSDGNPEFFMTCHYQNSAVPTRGYILYQVNPGNNYLEGCAGYRIYPNVRDGEPFGLNPEVFPDLVLIRTNAEGIYGDSPSPFFGTRDLDANPTDFQILYVGLQGNSWTVSDFNLDGWAEIVGGYPEDFERKKVQVFSLWRHPTGEWDPDVDTADVVILNDGVGGYFGARLAVGDPNDDGYPDLLVGETRETSPDGTPLVGAVFMFDLHSLIDTYETEPREFPLFSLYPSITKGDLTLQFSLNSDSDVSLRIFDLSGRVAQLQDFGKLGKGKHQIILDLRGLSQGVYVLELKRGDLRTRRVFALLK